MEIDDLNEDIEQKAVGEEVLSIHQTKKTLMFALHIHLNQFELHLDSITNKYKTISLFWLLATYVAIGFLFSVESKNLQVNNFVTVSTVCLFGIIGISALWYIDIHTLHKFWGAFFVEGVKMEDKYKYLLKMGDLSLSLDTVRSRIRGHENCYIFANLLLTISAGIALILLVKSDNMRIGVCFATILFAFFMIKIMRGVGHRLQNAIESLLLKKRSR